MFEEDVVAVWLLLLFLFRRSVNGPMRASIVSLNAIERSAIVIVKMNKNSFIGIDGENIYLRDYGNEKGREYSKRYYTLIGIGNNYLSITVLDTDV